MISSQSTLATHRLLCPAAELIPLICVQFSICVGDSYIE